MPDAAFYQHIESDLKAFLARLPPEWTVAERTEVQDMIDVGEYGIALETLAAIVVESGKPLPLELLHPVNDLAKRMGISSDDAMRTLHRHLKVGA